MKMLHKLLLIVLLLVPITVLLQSGGRSVLVSAANEATTEDTLDGEEDGNVEETVDPGDSSVVGDKADLEDEEDSDGGLKPSPDADVYFLFTKPVTTLNNELPTGKEVQFLVGFANKGSKDFYVDTLDASFRYAMDFSYHLQNFTPIAYNRVVKPEQEVTLSYAFFVSEAYSTRPYGFTVSLYYRDADNNQYMNAVFNETVSIVELEEGLDGETFFLYVFLAACVILIGVVLQQFFISFGKKRLSTKPTIEKGTSNPNDVDYDWLPQETLNSLNKSPRPPKQSPRQRRVKRGTGSSDE